MKIKLTYICENIVQFSSDYGMGLGKWMDGVPQLGQEYYVEFEICDVFTIYDFSIADLKKCIIEVEDKNNVLTMFLSDYEDTGCASFILGDTVIDIETKFNDGFARLINKYLTFQVKNLCIYSIDIS